ncbi:hypothetical protein HPB52_000189 [Rhipicephalus sanguineus]|uniref:Carrier domain-containing protein n=1 Tax=Rhipicephalus sanguineus TaxID=34632 RepID=A0A9D4PTE5_RHISA|nr:hypothetical protein HPB52_000189 [Rhipicephalus sanguineus]
MGATAARERLSQRHNLHATNAVFTDAAPDGQSLAFAWYKPSTEKNGIDTRFAWTPGHVGFKEEVTRWHTVSPPRLLEFYHIISNFSYKDLLFLVATPTRICHRALIPKWHDCDASSSLAIQWGPIGDVGAMSESDVRTPCGTVPQRIRCCLEVLDVLLCQSCPVVSSFVKGDPSREHEDKNKRTLLQSVTNILGIKDLSHVNESVTLGELGIDSLMSGDVRHLLERECELMFSERDIYQLTITRLREIDKDGCSTTAS